MGLRRRENDVHSKRTGSFLKEAAWELGLGERHSRRETAWGEVSSWACPECPGAPAGGPRDLVWEARKMLQTPIPLCSRVPCPSHLSLNLLHQPHERGTVSPSFCRWENQGTERKGQFHAVTQQVSYRAGIRTQVLTHHSFWREARASLMAQRVKNPPAMQETQEMWVQSLGREDPLEEEMATHSCILAWETPWTEEPGGLQSLGLQRVGHN